MKRILLCALMFMLVACQPKEKIPTQPKPTGFKVVLSEDKTIAIGDTLKQPNKYFKDYKKEKNAYFNDDIEIIVDEKKTILRITLLNDTYCLDNDMKVSQTLDHVTNLYDEKDIVCNNQNLCEILDSSGTVDLTIDIQDGHINRIRLIDLTHSIKEELTKDQQDALLNQCMMFLPESMYNELEKKGIYYRIDQTVYVVDDEKDPQISLNFTYNAQNKLIQYINQPYGFLSQDGTELLNEQEARECVQQFTQAMFHTDVVLQLIENTSSYNENYMTFIDQQNNEYIVDLSLQILSKYISEDMK